MTKHEPGVSESLQGRSLRSNSQPRSNPVLTDRALNLEMTPHTVTHPLVKRQDEPTYGSTQETASITSDSGSDPTAPSTTKSGNNPITTLEAQDPSLIGTIYTIDVMVDGVALPVHVDTGSSQFWAAHDQCQECKQSNMTTIKTALPDGCGYDENAINITYATGWVQGCHVNTSITLGEDTLQNYPVLAVIKAGGGAEAYGAYYSGLIGLGSEGPNPEGISTVVTALYRQGAIQAPIVGFFLPKAGDSQESELTFGDPTTSEHADGSNKVVLARQGGDSGNYIVRMDSFVIGSDTVSLGADCVLDTGSSGIAVPQDSLAQIYQSAYGLDSTDSGRVSCKPPASNTGVWVTFGGKAFEVPYDDLVFPLANGNDDCAPLITSYSGDVSDIWLFGDAFLHNIYHSVNVQTGEVAIFELKGGQ
ncbi:uncharacterized protein I206_106087 [Kwoniella pini CBS 10737]|uniref:Peptidase A1 domain-containing protein n=1 Tax=Kwoniella pini CBS 10737 TaxID=1296096 RepID=A0A1B9I109_9TREE|nr:uncharacterized protein I206_04911 [Kwoniella pini CBS 10737]OCF49223.1 hypothetical protein I206_04911 [Kwoniella pini CBS 10737]